MHTRALQRAKGIRYVFEAVPRVLAKHPEAYFIFIGLGPFEPLGKLGMEGRIFEDKRGH